MADLPVTPLANYGELLSSLPLAASTVATQSAQQNLMRAQVGQTQANIGMTQAQTQGVDIANQGAALSLGALKQAYANGVPGVPGAPSGVSSSGIGSSGVDEASITQHAIDQFAPIPTKPPPALQQQAYLLSLGGRPEAGKLLLDNYALQVGGVNQQKQLGANAATQTAETIASAPPGSAWEVLNRTNPQAAAAFKQKYANDTPEQLDKDTREMAQHIGLATYQYSGRESEFQNGVLVDKKSGKPVTGSQQLLTGLDAAGKEKAFAQANDPVTVGDQLPTPRWKAEGYASPTAFVMAADKAARSSATSGTSDAKPSAPATSGATQPPAQGGGDPVLKNALADESYRYKPPQIPTATSQPELEANKATAQEAAKNYQTNANALKTSSDEVTGASAKALQYFNAAKMILAQPNSAWAAGTPGGVAAMLSKLGIQTDANTTRAEVVKNLTQAALQGLKTTYGSKPAMFDVKVNLEQAFPDIKGDQGLPAVKNLIDENLRNLNYDIASGQRVTKYLGAGNDPSRFNTWNEDKFQRSANVNPGGTRTVAPAGGGPAVGTVKGGYKFTGGNPADRASWVKQ